MPFIRRLGYFLLGLSIGLIFLAIFLRKKSDETGTEFCYLPNCRVLKELRSKPYAFSGSDLDPSLDTLQINRILTDGDILFKRSEPRAEPCGIYYVEYDTDTGNSLLKVENCKDSVRILSYTH